MPAEKGSAFLLKVGDGTSTPVYATVAGLRTTQLSINARQCEAVDCDRLNIVVISDAILASFQIYFIAKVFTILITTNLLINLRACLVDWACLHVQD